MFRNLTFRKIEPTETSFGILWSIRDLTRCPGVEPVFRECHHGRIVCMSLIATRIVKRILRRIVRITVGESVLRMDADVSNGSRMTSRP